MNCCERGCAAAVVVNITCPPEERRVQQGCTGALLADPGITRAFVPTLCSTARFSCLYLSNHFREEFSSERTLILLNHYISHQTLALFVFVLTSERLHIARKSSLSAAEIHFLFRWSLLRKHLLCPHPEAGARGRPPMVDGADNAARPPHFLRAGRLVGIGGDCRRLVNICRDGPGEYDKFLYLRY